MFQLTNCRYPTTKVPRRSWMNLIWAFILVTICKQKTVSSVKWCFRYVQFPKRQFLNQIKRRSVKLSAHSLTQKRSSMPPSRSNDKSGTEVLIRYGGLLRTHVDHMLWFLTEGQVSVSTLSLQVGPPGSLTNRPKVEVSTSRIQQIYTPGSILSDDSKHSGQDTISLLSARINGCPLLIALLDFYRAIGLLAFALQRRW